MKLFRVIFVRLSVHKSSLLFQMKNFIKIIDLIERKLFKLVKNFDSYSESVDSVLI